MRLENLSALFVVTLGCVFAFSSQALAWGSCGRGPWVGYDDVSHCYCDDSTSGYAIAGDAGMHLNATQGPANSWVAAEFEATDTLGRRVFVPATNIRTNSSGDQFWDAIRSLLGHHTTQTVVLPFWAHGYSFSGRYRSVCLTNYTSFSLPSLGSPWAY